jgi:hypothetical protein
MKRVATSLLMVLTACFANTKGGAGVEESRNQQLYICVIDSGNLRMVGARLDSVSGDTLVDGRDFREAYPATAPPYAQAARLARSLVEFGDARYYAQGPARHLPPDALTKVGELNGVPVFAEVGTPTNPPGAIFLPVGPGCEFQLLVGFNDIRAE